MNKVEACFYAAVRRARDGREFILPDELSSSKPVVEMNVEAADKELPSFAEKNPVVRVVVIRVEEL